VQIKLDPIRCIAKIIRVAGLSRILFQCFIGDAYCEAKALGWIKAETES